MTDKNDRVGQQNDNERLKGSQTDPQKTELEGLKQGGVKPAVYPSDEKKTSDNAEQPEQEDE